jgi:4'-phosphopantetheinyl transferase
MNENLYWLTQNLEDVPEHSEWLSDGERSILDGLRFPKRRNDWRLGRWTAKQAVCAYQRKADPMLFQLEIRAAADGAPEAFWNNNPSNVAISISHSNERSFCAVGPRDFAIGCDLELVESRDDSLVRDYFTPEEISFCRKAPIHDQSLTINLIWSAKESVLKALREGLRRDTRSVTVHPESWNQEGAWNAWTGRCHDTSAIFNGWWRAWDGYIYTITSDRPTASPEQLWV